MKILKYKLTWNEGDAAQKAAEASSVTIEMPTNALVLSVAIDPAKTWASFPIVYALIDSEEERTEKRTFRLVRVGAEKGTPGPKEGTYVGAVRCRGDKRSLHVFAMK